MEYAKQEFKFSKQVGKSGGTVKEQLLSVWRQTGIKPKELEELPELPESCVHIWQWFLDLHTSRSSTGFGINPISFTDIKSYFDLIGVSPFEWEIKLIKAFDSLILKSYEEDAKKSQEKK